MIEAYDVGSLPFSGDFDKFIEGSRSRPGSESWSYFGKKIVEGFMLKVRAGIDVPNFPQFRDMMEMFLGVLDGVQKSEEGYIVVGPIRVQSDKLILPEVEAIRRNVSVLYEKLGEPIRLKVCITGPYTLSTVFSREIDRSWLIEQLGNALAKIAEENVFRMEKIRVEMVSMDEPVLGLIDDPLLDYGSRTRDVLLKAWEKIFSNCKSRGALTCIHLHSTSNKIFWELKSLDVIESHVDDPIYNSSRVKSLLEERDMFLKASIARTDFDALIRKGLRELSGKGVTIEERMGEIWKGIQKSKIDPVQFLEDVDLLAHRLTEVVNLFGCDRVKYAGPECGLRSLPSDKCAFECLRRSAEAVRTVNESLLSKI
ncbi:MAG: hypothetical protein DRN90_03375 [Thermoproteota archaeon]|nr:MAG: hypothetical protein DRN92_01900 [Candidatus Korarchaeota archaeon]RLG48555.1 MAG: hypothetical protein DRN90_03375 [Candidatus Korarchaeota archaeon]